jgi:hypothetical protein
MSIAFEIGVASSEEHAVHHTGEVMNNGKRICAARGIFGDVVLRSRL